MVLVVERLAGWLAASLTWPTLIPPALQGVLHSPFSPRQSSDWIGKSSRSPVKAIGADTQCNRFQYFHIDNSGSTESMIRSRGKIPPLFLLVDDMTAEKGPNGTWSTCPHFPNPATFDLRVEGRDKTRGRCTDAEVTFSLLVGPIRCGTRSRMTASLEREKAIHDADLTCAFSKCHAAFKAKQKPASASSPSLARA